MASNARVLNVTTGLRIKRSQAAGRIEQCVSQWVEHGFTIRDLTLAERIQARAIKAKESEPIPFAEIPGIIFQHAGHESDIYREMQLVAQANRYVLEHANN